MNEQGKRKDEKDADGTWEKKTKQNKGKEKTRNTLFKMKRQQRRRHQ